MKYNKKKVPEQKPHKTFNSLTFYPINPYDHYSGVIASTVLSNGKKITVWGGSPSQKSDGVSRFDFKIENRDESPLFINGARTLREKCIDEITSTMVHIQKRWRS